MSKPKKTLAEQAVHHILTRLREDSKLAYYMGYGTESLELLCKAHAEHKGVKDWEAFYEEFVRQLKTEAPPDCKECDQSAFCYSCECNDCSKCTQERLSDFNATNLYQFNLLLENSQGIVDSQGKLQTWSSIDPVGYIRKTLRELSRL